MVSLVFKNILLVCVGNICRSPTAELLLKNRLEGSGVKVSSAGLGALVGKPVDSAALAVLTRHGVVATEHQARQLSPAMLREADLVLVMEDSHLQGVNAMAPEARGKTFLLGKWLDDCEIPDPYRQEAAAFEHAYALISSCVDEWVRRIRPSR